MIFDELFPALDTASATSFTIKSAVKNAAQKLEQRAAEIAADVVRADELAKSVFAAAHAASTALERELHEIDAEIVTARGERGEALASGAPCAELDKSLRRLGERRDRAEDELAARALRVAPLQRASLVAHAAALAARRAAVAELAREANALAEDAKRRAGVAWELSQAMSRLLDLYSAGWSRAHNAVAAHDAKAGLV